MDTFQCAGCKKTIPVGRETFSFQDLGDVCKPCFYDEKYYTQYEPNAEKLEGKVQEVVEEEEEINGTD